MKPVYFDNAATTQIREEVIEAMTENMKINYGNASSSHSFGRSSKSIVEGCRKKIATHFKASPGEIVFTSGGTEADNLILRSAVRDLGVKHVITSKIEHHAILHTLEQLEDEYDITCSFVNLNASGQIDEQHLNALLEKSVHKTLVALMFVNNEIGNVLNVDPIVHLVKKHQALFHTDAVQAIGHYALDLEKTPIDFFAASAHKFHGPKGVGFAFVRKDSGLKPLIFGGEQERGFRAGTESTHNIVGLSTALDLAYENLMKEQNYIESLKSHFIQRIKMELSEVKFNGMSESLNESTYTLINICLPVPEEKAAMLLFQLDLKGIACSKGSACQSGSAKGSHVLAEILTEEELKHPSIRFSFSIYNTIEEVDYVVNTLKELTSN